MHFKFFNRYFQYLHGAKIEKIYKGIFSENTPSQPCPHTMCPVSSPTCPHRKPLFCILSDTSLCTSNCNHTFLFLPHFYTKGSNFIHCSKAYFLTQNITSIFINLLILTNVSPKIFWLISKKGCLPLRSYIGMGHQYQKPFQIRRSTNVLCGSQGENLCLSTFLYN